MLLLILLALPLTAGLLLPAARGGRCPVVAGVLAAMGTLVVAVAVAV